jgi:hypothetical protein
MLGQNLVCMLVHVCVPVLTHQETLQSLHSVLKQVWIASHLVMESLVWIMNVQLSI